MNAPIDTLEVLKQLRAAGFEERQAEALTHVFRQTQNVDLSNFAIKADLQEVRAELQEVRAELRSEILAAKVELMRWMFAQTFVIIGAVVAILRFTGH